MPKVPVHPARRYDEHLLLKVPPPLWLTMLFLVRHGFFVILSYLPRTEERMTYLRDLVNPWFLLADLPAALVLFAAVRRKAAAPVWVRRLWHRGLPLLTLSALLYLLLLAFSLATSARPLQSAINEAVILSVVMHLVILNYLTRTPLIIDVFAEFSTNPKPPIPRRWKHPE